MKNSKKNFFCSSDEASIDEEGINRMNRITGLIYLLARDDDLSEVSPSQDSIFLDEWFFNGFPRFTEMRNKMWVIFNNS